MQRILRNDFVDIASYISINNEHPAAIYFYVLMGIWFKNAKIVSSANGKDLRIHFTWVQTSRTGKGEMNKLMENICEKVGITCTKVTQYNTAGLIGTINESNIKYNETHNLTPEYPQIIKTNKAGIEKEYCYKDPVIIGDVGKNEIIIFDEFKILLEPSKDNQEIMLILQPVLDSPPKVYKKMKYDIPVEYSNPVSIVGTTYPFDSINAV